MHPCELDAAPANSQAAERMVPNVGGAECFPVWPIMPPPKFQGENLFSFLFTFERHADYLRVQGRDRCKMASKYMTEDYALIFDNFAKVAGGNWEKAKESFLSLLEPQEREKTPEQIAEEHLAKPLDVKNNPVQRIVIAGELINLVTNWTETIKIRKLIWFIPRSWAKEIIRNYDTTAYFSDIVKRVKAVAEHHENLQAFYQDWDDEGNSGESKDRSLEPTAFSTPKVAELSKDHLRDREIDDLKDKLAKLAFKIEALTKEKDAARITCYHCDRDGCRAGACIAVCEDMDRGLFKGVKATETRGLPYAASSVRVWGKVCGCDVKIVIAPGSAVSVCNLQWCREIGLDFCDEVAISVVDVNDQRKRASGVCPYVPVQIGDTRISTDVVAIADFKHPLLLGQPFLDQADWEVGLNAEGVRVYRLTDGKNTVSFPIQLGSMLYCNPVTQEVDVPDRNYHVSSFYTSGDRVAEPDSAKVDAA
ncbi:hypothetical protein GQ54DRAFT_221814 [Martensiomyces pterosporus]|nr:hypothetical protein GQ54DRAFT_221814 [Martensiomyces pterosporus]